MSVSLIDVASRIADFTDGTTKPPYYYTTYEQYLRPIRTRESPRLIEVGIYKGESARIFGEFFAAGQVLAVDVVDREIDFSTSPNVRFALADQTDANRLTDLANEFAPDGLDVVIDDASHLGWYSKLTYDALFPLLKPGGLYIVEDWGTGYIGSWYDGGPFTPVRPDEHDIPKRLTSHDYGMVGFVKSLVDSVWTESIRSALDAPPGPPSPVASLHVHNGLVVVRKS